MTCGTTAGYNTHRNRGEDTCPACRTAWRDYQLEREAASPRCEIPGCDRGVRARNRCSSHWQWLQLYGPTGRPPTKSELFWAQVTLGSISRHGSKLGPCWLWTGTVGTKGYGKFARPGGLAHVFSYLDMVGEIPAGYTIDHLCMVKLCVNPYHLDPVPRGVNARRYWDYYREMRKTA